MSLKHWSEQEKFCPNRLHLFWSRANDGQLILLGSVGQTELQAMVWTYNLYGLAKTRDHLRVTRSSWAGSHAARRSLTRGKMLLGSLLWSKQLMSLWTVIFIWQWHVIHPLKSFRFISACDESLISPYHLMANVRRHVMGIQDSIITVKSVWLKPRFSQNYLKKYRDSLRRNLISIFFFGRWKSVASLN